MNAHSIGRAAAKVTSIGGEARVIGVTSRGLFLSIDQRVLFVSFERWRGPLTINVEWPVECATGEVVRLSATRLIFPATKIDLSTAAVWRSPEPSASARPIADQREALKHLASSVLARKAPDGFGPLLPHLLDLPEKQALSASEAALLARLIQLRDSLSDAAFDQATVLIENLLGLGRGLTPSGDDVTIGFLLAVNRWRRNQNWRDLNQRVIDLAYQRTTTISANLIECATQDEADERLINVVDGLVTGAPSLEECVDYVLDWGSSSGSDALIGVTLALMM